MLMAHNRRPRRLFAISAGTLVLCLLLLLAMSPREPPPDSSMPEYQREQQQQQQQQQQEKEGSGGWADSYLKRKADAKLTRLLDQASLVSPLRQCAADSFTVHGSLPALAMQELLFSIDVHNVRAQLGEFAVEATAHNLPCKKTLESGACCDLKLSFRRNTTDLDVFKQVFQCHYMRYFYSLFEGSEPPRYILDAGANVGFSTVLFKVLWPEAVVVALEPDSGNFEQLKANTGGLKDVLTLNAGLWSRQVDIVMKASHGAWGRIFREAEGGEKGMPAYSVQDVAKEMGIPAFDFVKIDIEGAEGMVFQPGADFDWIQMARLVSLEVHDFFHAYFGLEKHDISQRIDDAFKPTGYTVISDNEHILYLAPELRDSVAKLPPPTQEQLKEADSKVRMLAGC